MPIVNVEQPKIISVDGDVRLRHYESIPGCALGWYQDLDTVWLVDADRKPYDQELLNRMYSWLDSHGELYFIEVRKDEVWTPIGDVTFWREDMPIVIGDPAYRGRGIGRKVVAVLIERGKQLGYHNLHVDEIYDHNPGSRKCFESLGFRAYEKTDKGSRFILQI